MSDLASDENSSLINGAIVDNIYRDFWHRKFILGPPLRVSDLTGQNGVDAETRRHRFATLYLASRAGATRKFERVESRASRKPGYQRTSARYIPMPSLDLACRSRLWRLGLEGPPSDFITWPTNQPKALRLSLACATLSGLACDDLVHHLSHGPRGRVNCFMPRASTVTDGGRRPRLRRSRQVLSRILPEIDRTSPMQSTSAASCPANTARARNIPPSLFEHGRHSSLITQFARVAVAGLVARPASTVYRKSRALRSPPARWRS